MKSKWSNRPSNCLEDECLKYMRNHKVLGRVLEKFIVKYESYGEVIGRISTSKVTLEELEILEGFFQKNYHGKKQISISAKDLMKAMQNSRFSEISVQRLLELYASEELYSKSELKQKEVEKWSRMFQEAETIYKGTIAIQWLKSLQDTRQYGYAHLQNIYRESKQQISEVKGILLLGCEIVNHLPTRRNNQEYLAIFATRITGNPHAFDDKTTMGKYLLQILQWEMTRSDSTGNREIRTTFLSLQKQKLFLNAGILRDEISNYIVVSGIQAMTQSGHYHQGMEGFLAEEDSVQIPLSVLSTWGKVICPDNKLYIVENPSVYASLVNQWGKAKAVFCINGQPKLSTLVFLELLEKEKVHIYYWGDFDPEGLLIAHKIKAYYNGLFTYWNMSLEDYKKAQSNEMISAKRLASLKQITDQELQDVVTEMKKSQKAGYQEMLLIK